MKFVLIILVITSSLVAAIIQTDSASMIEIFSKKTSTSTVVAKVSSSKGRLNIKFCTQVSNDRDWCKVQYIESSTVVNGYVEKYLLDKLKKTVKTSSTYETSFGGARNDVAYAVLPLEDGALLVGYTESFGAVRSDGYVIKVDEYGNKIFSSVFGGKDDDILNAAIVLKDSYALVGTTRSYRKALESIYFAKLSKDGELLSKEALYSDVDDHYRGNGVVKDGNENLIIVGNEEHKKLFTSNKDGYLNIVNPSGKNQTFRRYGGGDIDNINSIVSVSDGYVLAGSTKSWGTGSSDMYVVKTDKQGNLKWQNAFGFKYEEVANQIITTEDGGFILVGTTESYKNNQKDMFVVKISSKGNREWMNNYGTQEDEEAFGIVETNDGYMITGYTKYTKNYKSDVAVLKIDKEGSVVYHRTYGGLKDDKAYAIAKVKDGYLIAGYTTSSESYSKDVYLLRVDMKGMLR